MKIDHTEPADAGADAVNDWLEKAGLNLTDAEFSHIQQTLEYEIKIIVRNHQEAA